VEIVSGSRGEGTEFVALLVVVVLLYIGNVHTAGNVVAVGEGASGSGEQYGSNSETHASGRSYIVHPFRMS